jgi:DNA repair protein RadA/Sms
LLKKSFKKEKKTAEEKSAATKAKPLRINEIDSAQEIRMDTTDAELNRRWRVSFRVL